MSPIFNTYAYWKFGLIGHQPSAAKSCIWTYISYICRNRGLGLVCSILILFLHFDKLMNSVSGANTDFFPQEVIPSVTVSKILFWIYFFHHEYNYDEHPAISQIIFVRKKIVSRWKNIWVRFHFLFLQKKVWIQYVQILGKRIKCIIS